jgi:hypothetical protein
VLVCLTCFNGGCSGEGRRHAFLHHEKTRHPLGVVIKRTRKEPKKRVGQLARYPSLGTPCGDREDQLNNAGLARAANEETRDHRSDR